jgi:hypothetical protein
MSVSPRSRHYRHAPVNEEEGMPSNRRLPGTLTRPLLLASVLALALPAAPAAAQATWTVVPTPNPSTVTNVLQDGYTAPPSAGNRTLSIRTTTG